MLGKITASLTPWIHPVDSQVEHAKANEYLINMDYVIDVEDKTTYRILRYKFNVYDDRQPDFSIYVGETMLAIKALSDVSQDANMINLDVFEGIDSFNQVSGLTAVETAFNVSSIVWGDTDKGDDYTRLWYVVGGKAAKPIIVDHTIEEIINKL
jgi:hypothetical protein